MTNRKNDESKKWHAKMIAKQPGVLLQPEETITEMSLATVLDAATDDTLLAIAVALPTPTDLLRLVLTCHAMAQRFYSTSPPRATAAPPLCPAAAPQPRWHSSRRRRGRSYRRLRANGSPPAPTRSAAGCLGAVVRAGWA
jgi:hypothetical protein